MDNWDDVVERAINAYQELECGSGFKKSFSAAGRVFVEAALEEAAKKIEARADELWTRNNCYQFSPDILDEAVVEIRALKDKLPW